MLDHFVLSPAAALLLTSGLMILATASFIDLLT